MQHAHQPIRQVRGGGEASTGHGAHAGRVRLQVPHHAGHGGQAERERVRRVEHRLLVLLHVLGVGERQALHHRQQRHQRAGDAAGLGAHQLGGVRVALLRHDGAAGGVGVR